MLAQDLVTFDQPAWMWLAMAAVVGPAWLARRPGAGPALWSVMLQMLAGVLLAAALAQPNLRWGGQANAEYLILQDRSGSTVSQPPVQLPTGMNARTLYFASDVGPSPPEGVARDRTRVGPALGLAAAQASRLAGVVVATDGQFQDPDWASSAKALGQSGAAVWIVPQESPPADAAVAQLLAQRDGPQARLRVTVTANARQSRRLVITRTGLDRPLVDRPLSLLAGDVTTIEAADPLGPEESAEYVAQLVPADTLDRNDRRSAVTLAHRDRLAVVGLKRGDLPDELARPAGLNAEAVEPSAAPRSAELWARYACVLLADATGTLLDRPQREALAQYVRNGGGLVLLGAGPHGSPADRDDPLNRVLPLLADPYQRRPLRLTIVLDSSGSMAQRIDGASRFSLAVEAVLLLRRHLTPGDALEVIRFSDRPQRLYAAGPGAIDFSAVRSALTNVTPGGPTMVEPALAQAAATAAGPDRQGLVILVSDLRTEKFDPAVVEKKLRDAGYALAMVVTQTPGDVSPASDSPIEALAAKMQAPMVRGGDMVGLADVFAAFVRQARGEAVRQGAFDLTLLGEAQAWAQAQRLAVGAYLPSAAAEEAQTLGRVGTDAALARWWAQLGRVVVLALPAEAPPNAAALELPAMQRLLGQALRYARAPVADPRLDVQWRCEGGRLVVTANVHDSAGPVNLLDLAAQVGLADGQVRRMDLAQVAPGRYEAMVDVPEPPQALAVRDAQGVRWQAGLGQSPPPEYQAIGPDWANLNALARYTGGRVVSSRDLAHRVASQARLAYRPIWGYLLAAAVALMLLEWACARSARNRAASTRS